MLASQLVTLSYPSVRRTDRAELVLGMMEDYGVRQLPVVENEVFEGLISREQLEEMDGAETLASIDRLTQASIPGNNHILTALRIFGEHKTDLIAVTGERSAYSGLITATDLLSALSHYTGADEPGGMLVLEMEKRNFSFGEITRLVETNDAYITQLNTTTDPTGMLLVTVKVNKAEISDILATFQRYDYNVRHYFGEEAYENELRENYDHLMAYLKI